MQSSNIIRLPLDNFAETSEQVSNGHDTIDETENNIKNSLLNTEEITPPINASPEKFLSLSELDLNKIKEEAKTLGFNDAKKELEAQQAQLENSINLKLDELKSTIDNFNLLNEAAFKVLSQNLTTIITNVLKKFISSQASFSAEKILEICSSFLDKLKNQSTLEVGLPNNLQNKLEDRLKDLFNKSGFKGNLEITTLDNDRKLTISWNVGKAEMDLSELQKAIESFLGQYSPSQN
jgi:hypothetical protein